MALTETWLKEDDDVIVGNCTPAGYTFVQKARHGKGGGGIGLLSKSTLSPKTDSLAQFKSFEALQTQISCNCRSIVLIVIYRPENVENH